MQTVSRKLDFNVAADHDAGTVAYLLAKRRTAGGYNWNYADVRCAKGLIEKGIQLPFAAFLPPSVPITQRSVFNMACEDYVKRTILETFGVLCQVKIVQKHKGKIQWLMTGVCPFHRHVHDSQHWYILEGKEETAVGCFFVNPDNPHHPKAWIPSLPLVAPGDNPVHYPVEISARPL